MRKTDIPVGTEFQLRDGEVVKVTKFTTCKDMEVVTESGEILKVTSTELKAGKIKGYKNIFEKNSRNISVGYSFSIDGIGYQVVECLGKESVLIERQDGQRFTSKKINIVRGRATGKGSNLKASDGWLIEGHVWIEGQAGRYSVSEHGEVYSYVSLPPKKIKTSLIYDKTRQQHTYEIFNISDFGVMRTTYVHRVVAAAFIPNPENKPEVNHIDGNKRNNHVSNLEWVTRSENAKHMHDSGLFLRRTGTKYDDKILKSIEQGWHELTSKQLSILKNEPEILLRLNVSIEEFFSLPLSKNKAKANKVPFYKIDKLLEHRSLTSLADEYGYSLSAFSKKFSRYKSKLAQNKNNS